MEKILSLHHRSTVEGCHQHFPGILRNTIEKYNTEIWWKYNGSTMEIQWRKYSTCVIVPLWKNVISTFLKYSELEMKEWSIWNFLFLLIFLLFLTILEASPMMCLHILALGIVTCGIIHYERDILSITWRDGPLLQIQEAGPALHLPYPPLLVLDHPRHKTTLAHFVYQLEVWAEWFCSQSRYHQTFRGPEQMEYSS